MAPKYARKALADALRAADIDDQVLAVGLFAQRGSTVGILAGGFVGDVVGGGLGGALGSALGELGAVAGGRTVAGDIHKLPSDLILGVCEEWVYGATLPGFRSLPSTLLFRIPRDGLTATRRDRVSVRVLELQAPGDPDAIMLEGSRNPMTGAKSVINALTRLSVPA